jgi:rare lipoprotein A
MIASAFIAMGQASWFKPPAMYGSKHVCAQNYKHGKPMDILIVNDENGKEIRCRVIGTGPFYGDRVLDVSSSAAKALGFYDHGTARVRVYEILHLPGAQHPDCKRRICGVFCFEVSHARQTQSLLAKQILQRPRSHSVPRWICRNRRPAHGRSVR